MAKTMEKQKNKTKDKAIQKHEDASQKLGKATETAEKGISVSLARDSIALTGCKTSGGAEAVIETAINAYASLSADVPNKTKDANDYLALMAELAPGDPLESLLLSQMLMVHKQAMHYLRLSNGTAETTVEIRTAWHKRYTSLMKLYAQQLEALDRHKRGGKQKMTIEHLHVHEGGQAVVGNINRGGGVKNEK
jgi:hypothetical protein